MHIYIYMLLALVNIQSDGVGLQTSIDVVISIVSVFIPYPVVIFSWDVWSDFRTFKF